MSVADDLVAQGLDEDDRVRLANEMSILNYQLDEHSPNMYNSA